MRRAGSRSMPTCGLFDMVVEKGRRDAKKGTGFWLTNEICYIIGVDRSAGRIASGRIVVESNVLEMTVPVM